MLHLPDAGVKVLNASTFGLGADDGHCVLRSASRERTRATCVKRAEYLPTFGALGLGKRVTVVWGVRSGRRRQRLRGR
jgi:hypothetical protein